MAFPSRTIRNIHFRFFPQFIPLFRSSFLSHHSRKWTWRTIVTSDQERARGQSYVSNTPFRKGQAKDLIYSLNGEERALLLRELQALQVNQQQTSSDDAGSVLPPTTAQLRAVGLHNAMPFIGFGFLDNFIMLIAGDYIDMTIGTALGITTLAAAGLGNMISDIAGIGSAWYVESMASRIGVLPPPLSPEQMRMRSTRWSAQLGRTLGVSLGCLLGMLPLLFLSRHKPSREEESEKK